MKLKKILIIYFQIDEYQLIVSNNGILIVCNVFLKKYKELIKNKKYITFRNFFFIDIFVDLSNTFYIAVYSRYS